MLFNGVFMQSPITVDDRRGKWNVKTEYWLMQDDTCHLPRPFIPPHIQGLTATWMPHYVVVEIQMQIRLKISFPVLNIIRHTRILTVSEAHNRVRHMRYCFNANTSSHRGCRSHSKWRAKFVTPSGIKPRNEELQELCFLSHTAGTSTIHLGKCM